MLVTAELGTSFMHSAYLSAFTLPNLFRRLLGEGALTSALIPVFSDEFHRYGLQSAFVLLNKVITWVALLLIALLGLGMTSISFLSKIEGLELRWYYVFNFSMMLLPYMIFICLTAVFSAVLNVLGKYFLPAMSAIWLNISMIVFLGWFGVTFASSQLMEIRWLIAGVIVGGVIQLIVPMVQLYMIGWRPRISLWISAPLLKITKLFIPGLIGASIMQVNVAISRLLAFELSDEAVAILYLSNRLVELPLGVFVIAAATVIFPDLSKFASNGNHDELAKIFRRGMDMIMAIVMPAAAGLLALRYEILTILFEWGAFGRSDVLSVAPVLGVLALAMPFYAMSTFLTRGFHSIKNTRTPVQISLVNFTVNIVATLVLMKPFGVMGIAWANFLSVVVQTILLYLFLIKAESSFELEGFVYPLFVTFFASGFMYVVVLFCQACVGSAFVAGKLCALMAVAGCVIVGMIAYFIVLNLLGMNRIFDKILTFMMEFLKNCKICK
jgi:putative peptidoglycan lipid II flippase